MKKALSFILIAILLLFTITSCTPQDQEKKITADDILGGWEYMEQVWCEFYSDGYCVIGGTTGKYSLDKESLAFTLTPAQGDSISFEWAGSLDNVTPENWYLENDTLYINGYQYTKSAEEITKPVNAAESTEASNTGSAKQTEAAQ